MNKKELKNKEKTRLKSFRDVIQYLYYRFSYFYEKKESPVGAEVRGFSVLIALFCFKMFTMVYFLNSMKLKYCTDFLFGFKSKLEKYMIGIIIAIIITIILYFSIGKPTYWELRTRFSEESISQRKKRGWIIIGYITFTVSLFALSIYIMEISR